MCWLPVHHSLTWVLLAHSTLGFKLTYYWSLEPRSFSLPSIQAILGASEGMETLEKEAATKCLTCEVRGVNIIVVFKWESLCSLVFISSHVGYVTGWKY